VHDIISRVDTIKTTNTKKSSPVLVSKKPIPKQFLKRGEGIQPGVGSLLDPEKEIKLKQSKELHNQMMTHYHTSSAPQTIRVRTGPGKYEVICLANI